MVLVLLWERCDEWLGAIIATLKIRRVLRILVTGTTPHFFYTPAKAGC